TTTPTAYPTTAPTASSTTAPTASLTASPPTPVAEVVLETSVATSVTIATAGSASSGGSGMLLQLQIIAMCFYLVLRDKPDVLTDISGSLQWLNLQPSFPMDNSGEECQSRDGEDAPYPFIPESKAEEAWRSFVNAWSLGAGTLVIIRVLQVMVKRGLPRIRLGMLSYPRLQVQFTFLALPGVAQSAAFVLAHADSLPPSCVLLAGASLLTIAGLISMICRVLHQGLIIEELWCHDVQLAQAVGYRHHWAPNLVSTSYKPASMLRMRRSEARIPPPSATTILHFSGCHAYG
ncbi:hypothetical protein CYMTET_26961, partial [Cymbomonas tetramitiformis]